MLPRRVLILGLLFLAVPLFGQTDDECLMCHGDASMMESMGVEEYESLVVDSEKYGGSTHAEMGGCVSCHSDITEFPHPEDPADVDCGMCHYDTQEQWQNSSHGLSVQAGHEDAATCSSCHTAHYVYPPSDSLSTVSRSNEWETCAKCHENEELIEEYDIPQPEAVEMYKTTVHGRELIDQGNLEAASCSDCHGSHKILAGRNIESTMHKMNVPETCGQCHSEIYSKFEQSIHGESLSDGNWEAPSCTDCHGEHSIQRTETEGSRVSKKRQAEQTCADCHNDPDLAAKYGFGAANQVSTYQDSYHGLAVLRGAEDAASCADCHNAHLILPQDDPESSIARSNIAETCGDCHEGATTQFGMSYTHESVMLGRFPVQDIVKWIYIALIILVIGGMFFHNLIIWIKKTRQKYRHEKKEATITRMTSNEMNQHWLLFISFTLLVITGFMLKFPEAGWVQLFSSIGINEAVRGTTHRVAAVVMIALSLYHLYFLIFTKRGREEIRELMFGIRDVKEFWQAMKYYFGKRPTPPSYGHYDYTQKAEYWALIWGTAVMAATGLILWFPTMLGENTPQWLIKVSETIHYYEAILATLAIVIWHFFFTIFHPDEYPMSMIWLNGEMTLEEWREKHPDKYQAMLREVQEYKNEKKSLDDLSIGAQAYVEKYGTEEPPAGE
ncbi:MAG: cytochrome b/b6 domain-containing protein [Candidatus Marinimicrobia bacterium]|nr:cytochrome b/b6 domain-containing protein [Candidatus Neomarinimicrobiota bacterium]MCF7828482.1 cytochrome b/b6 domain-containing protein [Candidatus Neomarinimicrobiota bacterium]MCF7881972.1 cytochrome b/b6 domain-containing protein [Candidatus Neomarinimicrobiota bacterium]